RCDRAAGCGARAGGAGAAVWARRLLSAPGRVCGGGRVPAAQFVGAVGPGGQRSDGLWPAGAGVGPLRLSGGPGEGGRERFYLRSVEERLVDGWIGSTWRVADPATG